MHKIWKSIEPSNYKNIKQCIIDLKKKGYYVSVWIDDICERGKIKITKEKVNLYRIKVSDLGFKNATTLDKIYKKFKKKGFSCVAPDIALRARFYYREQKTGEWLRFATPMRSMVDSDKVPHLPKLGKALKKYFIETYWSYPKAIFHPHNDFVVMKK